MAEVVDGVQQLSPQEAAARIESGAILVDVRESDERAQARIPGSLFIPLGLLPSHMDELPRDRLLIMQCASGARSHHAARMLGDQGFEVANLMHGIMGWYRMGLHVDVGPP